MIYDPLGEKQCKKCSNWYLASVWFFIAATSKKGRLSSPCRQCRNGNSKRWKDANRDRVNENKRNWGKNNPEKRNDMLRRWRLKNHEKDRETSRDRYNRNPQKILANNRKWAKRHPDSIRKSQKKYAKNHPEKVREREQRRKTRALALPATFTVDDWKYAIRYFQGCCAYCGMSSELHQDHYIPLSKGGGYTPDNMLPVCPQCNLSKHNRDPHIWLLARFGPHRTAEIESRIALYFDSIPKQA